MIERRDKDGWRTFTHAAGAHTLQAGRFAGNRRERRAQAAEQRRQIKRIKVLGVQLPNVPGEPGAN